MISSSISKVLNDQITNEFNSGYTYLAMSAHFAARNLNGFAHWFRVQYEEEPGTPLSAPSPKPSTRSGGSPSRSTS